MILKRTFLFLMFFLFSSSAFSQKVDDDDPLGFFLSSSSYGFCLKKTSICPGDGEKLSKYEGKIGRFMSLTPVHTEYRRDIYQVKMEDGRVFYYHTTRDSPFYKYATIPLAKHLENLGFEGKSVVEGSRFKVDKVFHDGTGYKFVLSTGYEMYGDEFQVLRLLLKTLPVDYEEVLFENLSNLRLSHDRVDNVFFLFPREELSIHNSDELALAPYVGVKDGKAWLRFKVYYKASRWLFADGFLVQADDFRKEYQNVRFKRDHSSGAIWEWLDRSAIDSDISLLRNVVESDDVVVRFYGSKYHDDREVTVKHKERIGSILAIYNLFKRTES